MKNMLAIVIAAIFMGSIPALAGNPTDGQREKAAHMQPTLRVPMEHLEGKVLFYSGPKDRGKFKGFVRGSPNLFKKPADGEIIIELLRQAQEKGVNPDAISHYLNFFKYGCPPHGGFGFGLTRMLMMMMGTQNVREVTYLYRGPNRLTP